MDTIFGWFGLVILLLNYLLVIKTTKWFFHIGLLGSLFYIIHAMIVVDYSVGLINVFMSIISIIKLIQNKINIKPNNI